MAVVFSSIGTQAWAQTGSPVLSVSYSLPTNQNVLPLPVGGTLQFPGTLVNTTIQATVFVSNTGSAPGALSSVTVTSTPATTFQLVGLPLPGVIVQPNTTIAFGLRYTPALIGNDTGTLSISLSGTTLNATVAGTGINSQFSYAVSTATGDIPFTTAQPLTFPDTPVATPVSLFIKVRNIGSAPGAVSAVATSGGPFVVPDGPITAVTLNPNDLLTFSVIFTPVQAGKVTGKLRVGNDVFDLAGTGLGPKLTFTYGSGTTVQAGGTVVFTPTQVGNTSQLSFTISNGGTATANIGSIAVADTKLIFRLVNVPPQPLTLNPGESATFNIIFAPAVTGFSTTSLQIDTQAFTLSGSGNPPPALPTFKFTGASGTVNPFQQPAVGLTLDAPYSLPLTGTFAITVNSAAFAPDAAVQFSTGGKTVNFTIPANTTQAVFPTGSNQVLLQTGTTASTITISPTFSTSAGLDITPPASPTTVLTVAASPPQLLRIQITNVTQVSFTVGVTGFSTTRSLSTLKFDFTPAGGGKIAPYTLDVAASAGLWYNSSASAPFGGQFSVAVPFSITNPSTTELATRVIQSVSVTATNGQGTSNAVSLTVQ